MKKLHLTFISATVASLLFVGCGGGGSDSGSNNSTSTSTTQQTTDTGSSSGTTPTTDTGSTSEPTTPTTPTKPTTRTKIVKTGQTKSYNYRGDIITDGSIKDDGYYQAGIDRSYTRRDVGIVKDNVTGLEWQDTPEGNSLYTQDNAKKYCSNLDLDGTGWRLSSMYDLWYLENYNRAQDVNGAKNILDAIFQNVTRTFYITTYERFWFKYGLDLSNGLFGRKHGDVGRVKCVRGAKTYTAKCSRDNNNDTVVCNDEGLMLQDVSANKTKKFTWEAGIKYCEDLEFAGYSDWRMPNINELRAFYYSKEILYKDSGSTHDNGGYWSSTSYIKMRGNAYFAPESSMSPYLNGVIGSIAMNKSNKAHVRCVR